MHAAQGPAWALAIEHSAIAEAMRGGVLLYPAVETLHILGFATLVGAILVLDLRLLGLGSSIEPERLARLAVPIAAAGLVVAAMMGALLFATEATAYVRNPAFQLKQVLIFAGLINIAAFHVWLRPALSTWQEGTPLLPSVRVSAAVSAFVWISVPICGRMIAYV